MIDITQADRDAAADFLESWVPGPEMTVVKLARALADHRETAFQAGVKAMQEAAARVASEAHLVQPYGGSPSEGECEVARNAAAYIRAINIDKLEAMEARDEE